MPREGTHIRRTNYAVNLRVYTRTRNNAGNFGRLHGSRGNAQRCIPCARGRRGTRLRRIMWRSAWFMRADALLSLCQCLSLSLERTHAKNVGTSVVYIGERRKRARRRSSTDGNERKRKGRESAYAGCDRVEDTEDDGAATMRTVEEDGTFACLRRFRAVSDNKRRSGRCDGKSFGRAFCESALNEKVEYLFSCSRTRRNISGIYFLRCLVLYNAGAAPERTEKLPGPFAEKRAREIEEFA